MDSAPIQFSFATSDVEEAQSFFSGAYAPVRVEPPKRGGLDIQVDAVSTAGLTVFSTSSPTGVVFQTASSFDGYNLSMPLAGGVEVDGRESGNLSQGFGEGLVVDGVQVTRAVFSQGLAFRGISVATNLLHAHLAGLLDAPVTRRVRFREALSLEGYTMRLALSLSALLQEGLSGEAPLAQSPLALSNLRTAITSLLVEAIPHSYSERLSGQHATWIAPRNVRLADEFMRAHAGEPISLNDIACAANTTPRALQASFQRFRSTTPIEHLRRIRLAGARADLLDPAKPCSVTQIALRWGFFRLSSFSAFYRKAFGEAPSETLRRR